jgi:hypothetical protein
VLKKNLVATLAALTALVVAAAVVSANPASDSTFKVTAKASPSKAGTKAKPKSSSLSLAFKGGTKSGTGQPETSTAIAVSLAKGWKFNGKIWPKSKRCDRSKANTQRSDSSCPKGSKIGGGTTTVAGINGAIKRTYTIRSYVLTNGTLGTWVQTPAGVSPVVNRMLGSKVSGGKITINIDKEVQEPVAGANTGILTLGFKLKAKAKVKGKNRGVVETTSCPKGGWKFKVTSIERTGKIPSTSTVKCKS